MFCNDCKNVVDFEENLPNFNKRKEGECMKKLIGILLFVFILTSFMYAQDKWTWMLYLYEDGTGLDGADDLNEWEDNGSSSDVNLLCLYDSDNNSEDGIYYIENDPGGYNSTIVSSIVSTHLNSGLDMNDWQTLEDYITWCATNYPADHYGLTVWDHGDGIFKGEITSGIFGNTKGCVGDMKLWEMDNALDTFTTQIGRKIDIVGFDVCLLGHIETAYQLKDHVDYVIASEKTEPGDGWDYQAAFSGLISNPDITPATLATNIVDAYVTFYGGKNGQSNGETQACTSTALLESDLIPALNNFANHLRGDIYTYETEIKTARDNASYWDSDSYGAIYIQQKDLGSFAENIIDDTSLPSTLRGYAQDVFDAISTAVIAEGHTVTDPAYGLKIWMPEDIGTDSNETYYMDTSNYLLFSETLWDEFLYNYNSPEPYDPDFPTVQNLTATSGDASILLEWDAPARNTLDHYRIERDDITIADNILAGTTSYFDNSLTNYTTYTYEVFAVYTGSPSGESIAISVDGTPMPPQIVLLTESFESGSVPPPSWTSIDSDGDGNNWFVGNTGYEPHDGSNVAVSASYDSGALIPDNWLISPQLSISADTALIKYWIKAQDPDWVGEKYSVYVSTSGNSVSNFTEEIYTETLTSADWGERLHYLSGYSGQSIYIAFRHYDCTDMFQIVLDDITIQEEIPGIYANFTGSPLTTYTGQNVTFTDASGGGTITSWSWEFGSGAIPATATGKGPHTVTYSTTGTKDVSLTVNETETETKVDYITVTDVPSFSLSPTSLDFGNIEVGSNSTLQFTITNNGGGTLTGNITTPTGYSVSEVTKSRIKKADQVKKIIRNTLDYNISDSQAFNVIFEPTTADNFDEIITITCDQDTAENVAVTGTGIAAEIAFSPTSLSQTMPENDTSTLNLEVSNIGDAELEYSASVVYSKNSRDIVFSEDFESGTWEPTGWTNYEAGDAAGWSESTVQANSPTRAAFHDDDNVATGCDDWLITPAIDLSGHTSPNLNYYEYVNYADWAGEHNVMYSTDYSGSGDPTSSTWIDLNTTIGTEDTWGQKGPYALPENSSVYIAFQYIGDYAAEWWIDDITIEGSPTATWLTINNDNPIVDQTVTPNNYDNILIGFDTNTRGLSAGTYYATIQFSSNDLNSPHSVNVALTVDNSDQTSTTGGGNNGSGTGAATADLPPIVLDGNIIDPDIDVDPGGEQIAIEVIVSDVNMLTNPVQNPDAVGIAYNISITGSLPATTNFTLYNVDDLANYPTEASWWNGSAWLTATADWSIPNQVSFDLPITNSKDGSTEIVLNKGGESPLPVSLSTFYATYSNRASLLEWTTQSELNNSHWNVYRGESENYGQAVISNAEPITGAGTTFEPTDYQYYDPNEVVANKTYWYWIENIDFSGQNQLYGPASILIPEDHQTSNPPEVPTKYGLYANYPNPFNPNTQISFALHEASNVDLIIYDAKGRKIKKLLMGENIPADQIIRIDWNGTDEYQKEVASGVYLYRLITKDREYTKKMMMIK